MAGSIFIKCTASFIHNLSIITIQFIYEKKFKLQCFGIIRICDGSIFANFLGSPSPMEFTSSINCKTKYICINSFIMKINDSQNFFGNLHVIQLTTNFKPEQIMTKSINPLIIHVDNPPQNYITF